MLGVLSMRTILVLLVTSPFLIFLNLPPLLDLPKQVLGIIVISVLFFYFIFRAKYWVRYSIAIWPYSIFFGWLLVSSFFSYGDFYFSFWHFLIAGVLGVFCLMLAPTSERIVGAERIQRFVSYAFAQSGLLVSIYGIFRFYGLAKFIIPWVEVDGARLLGPWGQPNLTALYMLIGLISLVSIFSERDRKYSPTFFFCLFVYIYSGIMTGSRAWLVMFFGYLAILFLSSILAARHNRQGIKSWRRNRSLSVVVFLTFVAIYLFAADLDQLVAEPLESVGILERNTASEMLGRHSDFSGQARIQEWMKASLYPELAENPWLGYGVGRYGVFSAQATISTLAEGHNKKYWDNAHNIFIMLLVEGGFVGLALVAFFAIFLACFLIRNILYGYKFYYSALISVIFVQNFIEFSFWYFPFLFLFLFLVGISFRSFEFSFSSKYILPTLSLGASLVLSLSVFLALKDYSTITEYYYKSFYTEEKNSTRSELALNLAKTNTFLGFAAWEVDVLANLPPDSGWKRQLVSIEKLWRWQPIQAFSIRRSTLLAALGSDEACSALRNTTLLYPDAFPRINEELIFFRNVDGFEYPLAHYLGCALQGMEYWIVGESAFVETEIEFHRL